MHLGLLNIFYNDNDNNIWFTYQELILTAEELEEKAKQALDSAHREPLAVLTEILEKAKLCRVRLPNVNVLKETCRYLFNTAIILRQIVCR